MAIAKKPKRNTDDTKGNAEDAASRFIAGAGQAEPPEDEKTGKITTTLRLDAALLKRVDAAAKRHGISRTAWISYTLSKTLDEDEQGAD